jgi:hypothetical protein
MNRTLTRRLDRLQKRLLPPDAPTKYWQIVYVSHEGTEDGPIIQWPAPHAFNENGWKPRPLK